MKTYINLSIWLGIINVLIFSVVFTSGCNSTKKLQANEGMVLTKPESEAPYILFLILDVIDKGDSEVPEIGLAKYKLKSGRLKNISIGDKVPKQAGNFTFKIIGESENEVYQFLNPLVENVEFVDEDGKLGRKEVRHAQKELIFRKQISDKVERVDVYYNSLEQAEKIKVYSVKIN